MKKKAVIYVSGPYSNQSMHRVHENIQFARSCALEVWHHGGVAICPHLNTMFMDGAYHMEKRVWIEGDLELVRRCDAIWMIGKWQESEGSLLEFEAARKLGLRVCYSLDEVIGYLNWFYWLAEL